MGLFFITTSDVLEKTSSAFGSCRQHSEVCQELCLAPHKIPSPAQQGEEPVCRSAPALSCFSESYIGGMKSPRLKDTG